MTPDPGPSVPPRPRRRPRARPGALGARALGLLSLGLILSLTPGCGSYSWGYRPVGGLTEVAVPIFENRTLRRGYEYELATHLRRRILDQTPLQLGREGSAPAVLRGAIVSVTQGLLIPSFTDPTTPAEGSITISVEVALYDRRSDRLIVGQDTDGDGRPDAPAILTETENYVPSLAQTPDSAADRALRKLAERIVDLCEARWGGAQER